MAIATTTRQSPFIKPNDANRWSHIDDATLSSTFRINCDSNSFEWVIYCCASDDDYDSVDVDDGSKEIRQRDEIKTQTFKNPHYLFVSANKNPHT